MSYNWQGVECREKTENYQKEGIVTGSNQTIEKTANSSILTFKEYGFENPVLEGVFFFCKFSTVF